jgi:hypothetical protein
LHHNILPCTFVNVFNIKLNINMKMRKLLLVFCGTLLTTGAVYSQASKREEGIKLGFKSGLNVSNFMSSDIEEDMAFRTSIHIGFLAEVIISDKASFQPELLYSGQGYVGEETKKKFNYINVPLLLKYYVADNISIEAGPQVGFLINSIERGNNGNTDFEDQNIVDFGVNIGLGYEFPSGIFFQGRYNLGLTNINGSDDSDKFSYSNSVFQISVGYMF